jgi:geranylgeranyl diphosphate synthase type II
MTYFDRFEVFLQHFSPMIESRLEGVLSGHFQDDRHILLEAMRYSVLTKAKRIRPHLILATTRVLGLDITPMLDLCVAVELVHTYSLIHDDLPAMDNDDYRRGQLTCHKRYGDDIAILAGDTLHSLAFELLSTQLIRSVEPARVCRVMALFAQSIGLHGMAGGQCIDLKKTAAHEGISEDELMVMHQLKTGALIKACVTMPLLMVDCPDVIVENALTSFGEHLGLLFQISDDILDVEGSLLTLGKTPNKDVDQSKLTYVTVFGIERAKALALHEYVSCQNVLNTLKSTYTVVELEGVLDAIYYRKS